jgi:hypothetical protein
VNGRGWSSLTSLLVRVAVVVVGLHVFELLWRALLIAVAALTVMAVVVAVAVRLLLLRWRGW